MEVTPGSSSSATSRRGSSAHVTFFGPKIFTGRGCVVLGKGGGGWFGWGVGLGELKLNMDITFGVFSRVDKSSNLWHSQKTPFFGPPPTLRGVFILVGWPKPES